MAMHHQFPIYFRQRGCSVDVTRPSERCRRSAILSIFTLFFLLFFGFLAGCTLKSKLPEPVTPSLPQEKIVIKEPSAAHETSMGSAKEKRLAPLMAIERQADEAAASGEYRPALNDYNMLLSKYPLEMRGGVLKKIEPLLSKIEASDIELILQSTINRIPRSMLLYHLGMRHLADGESERAREVLTQFITTYPEHQDAKMAREMVAALNDASYQGERIGCMLPLSGKYAVFGEKALKGIQMAIRDLTPLYSRKIRLIVKDTASDSDLAVQCVRALAHENVAAIAGPMVTSVAAAAEAQKQKIPMICMTQKSEVTDTGEYVFANFLTPELQVNALLGYVHNHLGVNRFGIIYPDDRYGNRYMELFSEWADELGADISSRLSYSLDKKDFGDIVQKTARALGISTKASPTSEHLDKAVFIPGSPKELAMILPQFAYHNVSNIYLLGTNLWHHPYLLEHAADYVKHAVVTDGFFNESRRAETARFSEAFQLVYGESPGFIEAIAYDTVSMLIQSAMDPSIGSRVTLRHALAGNRIFDGVTGKTRFDEAGKIHKELFLLTVDKGRFIEIVSELNEGLTD